MRFLLHLLWRHLRQYPGRAAAALAVLALASTLMLALAGAGTALRFRIGSRLNDLFPEEQVRLETTRGRLGPIAIEAGLITDDTLQKLRAIPNVKAVHPIEAIRFPVRVEGTLFGTTISSDAVIHGMERTLVADAIGTRTAWTTPSGQEQFPVIVSSYFIDLYNLGMARSSGLPLISPDSIIDRHFKIYVGESTVGLGKTKEPVRWLDCRIVGISHQPGLLGLALPLEVVTGLNRMYAPDQPKSYVQVVAELARGADRANFVKAAASLGVRPSREEEIGSQIKLGVKLTGWGLIVLALAVFGLGLLTFYMLFAMIFHARRIDLIRLRAMGLTPTEAVLLAIGEVGVLAAGALIIATALNFIMGTIIQKLASPMLRQVSSIPANLFDWSPAWLAAAAFVILIVALIPALPMLHWVVRVEPGEVIRDL
ncbi:hypothetical protein LLG95_03625 [bacterium]|nr:hypothetical protein [bacterium]